jgi:SAM-dependent methyltransferase
MTDERVEKDPHEAVGGMWDILGRLQLDFLVGEGLRPQHRLLDIGCGTLRAGRHFIAYLDAERYTGLDISKKAIEFARKLVVDERLSQKRPTLVVSADNDLRLNEFAGKEFDFILAQSVFTHLPADAIDECMRNVGRVMAHGASFFFTYNEASEAIAQPIAMDFRYPSSFFADIAEANGFDLRDHAPAYAHPAGQHMLSVTRRG